MNLFSQEIAEETEGNMNNKDATRARILNLCDFVPLLFNPSPPIRVIRGRK